MKLKITEHVSQSAKGTHVYATEPLPGSAPFSHRILSRESFSPGDYVMVNTVRGALGVTVDEDGHPVMVWWV